MKYLSVCSGIEAATVAWHSLGWEPVAFAEIEPFPRAVLAHHYPNIPNLGDITKFQSWPAYAIDLLVGGTPCQSFSVAGLRKGLADPRGNLTLTYLAIAARYRPRWLVWENVPGVLSDKTGAFGALLGGLAELGYGFAYAVRDAQFVRVEPHARAVPQRRRRVFVVGHLGDWRRAAAVLFERASLRGDSPPCRQAGKGVAPTISARTKGGGGLGTDFDCDGGLVAAGNVSGTTHGYFREDFPMTTGGVDVAGCLQERDAKGCDSDTKPGHLIAIRRGGFFDDRVSHSLKADGFDASEDGTGRGTPLIAVGFQNTGQGYWQDEPVAQTLRDASAGGASHANIVAFSCKDHGADAGETSPTLRSMGHDGSHANGGGQVAIAFDTTQITSKTNRCNPQDGDPCHPLAAGAHPPAIAFNPQAGGKQSSLGFDPESRTTGTLESNQIPAIAIQAGALRENPESGPDGVGVRGDGAAFTIEARAEVQAVAFTQNQCGDVLSGAVCPSMGTNQNATGRNTPKVHCGMAVRRLTPKECERLQGFPDEYTAIPMKKGHAKDGPRYKALGNSMAVNVMRHIADRIQLVEQLTSEVSA